MHARVPYPRHRARYNETAAAAAAVEPTNAKTSTGACVCIFLSVLLQGFAHDGGVLPASICVQNLACGVRSTCVGYPKTVK